MTHDNGAPCAIRIADDGHADLGPTTSRFARTANTHSPTVFASLAAGLNPKQMLRDNLVFYAPLNGQSPELEIVGRLDLDLVGSPALVEEPPNIRRAMVAPG